MIASEFQSSFFPSGWCRSRSSWILHAASIAARERWFQEFLSMVPASGVRIFSPVCAMEKRRYSDQVMTLGRPNTRRSNGCSLSVRPIGMKCGRIFGCVTFFLSSALRWASEIGRSISSSSQAEMPRASSILSSALSTNLGSVIEGAIRKVSLPNVSSIPTSIDPRQHSLKGYCMAWRADAYESR
jgi:hypothetical protein